MVTIELLEKIAPKTKRDILLKYVEPLNEIAEYYEIHGKRLAAFLAQLAHESGGFSITRENLNYSQQGLRKTFPKYFPTDELALKYARQPEKIANRVYANRMANGDENSGDGWKYRGRGLIQLTGKFNYTKFSKAIDMSLEDTINYLETPSGAVSSAGWFWDTNKLNSYVDNNDFVGLTKRINGGTIGLADRKHHYELALKHLKV